MRPAVLRLISIDIEVNCQRSVSRARWYHATMLTELSAEEDGQVLLDELAEE